MNRWIVLFIVLLSLSLLSHVRIHWGGNEYIQSFSVSAIGYQVCGERITFNPWWKWRCTIWRRRHGNEWEQAFD